MIIFEPLYPGFKNKCLTFSYDDGVKQDLKFLDLIKNTKFKVTFNLNSGLFGQIKYRDGVDNSRLENNSLNKIYKHHEIASHSLYHFHMENISYEANCMQINEDINNLKRIFSCDIKGFAYPFGTYSIDTINALKDNGVLYARTTKSTYNYSLPDDFLLWNPSIHHNDKKIFDFVKEFKNTSSKMALLYIWGHTYEFDNQNNWNILEYIIAELDNLSDVAYLTNIEIYEYINALRNVIIKDNKIINESNVTLFIKRNDDFIKIKPLEIIEVEGEFLWKRL